MFKEPKRAIGTDTLIGQGTQAEGKLTSESGIRIEGEYRGDIECKGDVIIGECGLAKSNIIAKELTVAGKVFGDIFTEGRLTITASGQVHGTITANILLIQEGGILNGTCRMEKPDEQNAKPTPPAEQAQQEQQQQPQSQTQSAKDENGKEKARQAV